MAAGSPKVSAIWRYPVKSMLGEEIASTAIAERGLAGDRGYALVDIESGRVVSAKHPRQWAVMFDCRAEFLEEPDTDGDLAPVRITLPDGSTVRSDDPGIDDALSRATGRSVHLCTQVDGQPEIDEVVPGATEVTQFQLAPLAPGSFFDAAPVHVVTTATLAALAAAYPAGSFSPMRFRPNVLVETTDESGFVENAWVDHPLALGDRVELAILLAVPRCVMTTLAQGGLPADKGILQTVARENRIDIPGLGPSSCVGVYGIVSRGGTLNRGDAVAPA